MEKVKCTDDLFTFRGMRRVAMKRAWDLADEAAEAGKPIRLGDFGRFMKQAYKDVQEAQKTCPVPGVEDRKRNED